MVDKHEEERVELLLKVYDACATQEDWRRLKVLNFLRRRDAVAGGNKEKK